ncbi:MAG: amidase family protein, partial [Pirellulales bacterium]
ARYDGAHYGYRAKIDPRPSPLRYDDGDTPLVRMYRNSRSEAFGREVKRRIMLGTYALSAGYYDAYYLKALKVRRLIRQDYDAAFRHVDLIIGPVTATPAFPIGEKSGDPLAMYLVDLYTVGANLAGIPGISLPCGFSDSGLPIGLQLQGPPLAEDRLLRATHMFQQATDWHRKRPPLESRL